jgi:hypothetical protein
MTLGSFALDDFLLTRAKLFSDPCNRCLRPVVLTTKFTDPLCSHNVNNGRTVSYYFSLDIAQG